MIKMITFMSISWWHLLVATNGWKMDEVAMYFNLVFNFIHVINY